MEKNFVVLLFSDIIFGFVFLFYHTGIKEEKIGCVCMCVAVVEEEKAANVPCAKCDGWEHATLSPKTVATTAAAATTLTTTLAAASAAATLAAYYGRTVPNSKDMIPALFYMD
ncbi:Hypothetical predicted protein [Octopus vulgaris]|uniref:Uncharacterized protein n=1 Tax=Octopus vulgaris TaxID=6645 RepID=A0AA36AKI1_OCTVU|nr:Hypothetical predicted protein [Octopus vulgaris]